MESVKQKKLVLTLIGLPARGKSYLSQKLCTFFNWLQIPARIFNVGNYRRRFEGRYTGNNFFDSSNNDAVEIRKLSAEAAMDDMRNWLNYCDGEIAFFDATNTTRERRDWVKECIKDDNIDLLYLEIFCDDEDTINDNIMKVKLLNADYVDCLPENALKDFKSRISHYESVYEPVDPSQDENTSFIQIYNKGERYECNRIDTIYKTEVYNFVKSVCPTDRSLKIYVDLPLATADAMKPTCSSFIEIDGIVDNKVKIHNNNYMALDQDRMSNFERLHRNKDNINMVAVQLISVIVETEKHRNLSISCDEDVSKLLIRYFNSESVGKIWNGNAAPSILRVDCNCNYPLYTVEMVL